MITGLKISSTGLPANGYYGFRYTSGIVTDGLILHLDAANPASYPGSGNTWYDLSLSRNNATAINLPVFQSDNTGQFDFDGSNDYFQLASQIMLQSLSIWINVGQVNTIEYFFGNGINSGGVRYYYTTPNSWMVYSGAASGYSSVNWDRQDAMVNLSIRRKNTAEFEYFINGQYLGSGAQGGDTPANSILVDYIGRRQSGNYFKGEISTIQIYDKSLSDEEIIQNYNATKGRFGY